MHMMDDDTFFSRGSNWPAIFITDDSTSEMTTPLEVFPKSTLLSCILHVLQAFWQYFWDNKSGVPRDERPVIFVLYKDVVCASSIEHLEVAYEKAICSEVCVKHHKVTTCIQVMYDKKEVWAVCYRQDLPVRGNMTNNFCEAAKKVLKNHILQRTKAFIIQQLLDFIVSRMESYYQRGCFNIANNRLNLVKHFRCLLHGSVHPDIIQCVSEREFDVKSATDVSTVHRANKSLGFCSCPVGSTGGPCNHHGGIILKHGTGS